MYLLNPSPRPLVPWGLLNVHPYPEALVREVAELTNNGQNQAALNECYAEFKQWMLDNGYTPDWE